MASKNLPFKATVLTWARAPQKLRIAIAVLAFANVAVPAILSPYNYSVSQLVLAMILLDVCLYPTLRYLVRKEGLPVLPLLCLAFAVQFATPIFTQVPGVDSIHGFR